MTTPTPKSLADVLAARKAAAPPAPVQDPAVTTALEELEEAILEDAEWHNSELDKLDTAYKKLQDLQAKDATTLQEVADLRTEVRGNEPPVFNRRQPSRHAADRPHIPVRQRVSGLLDKVAGPKKPNDTTGPAKSDTTGK